MLHADQIEKMLLENYSYLVATGAYIREQSRWPDNIDLQIEELLEYNRNHMLYLNNLIEQKQFTEVIANAEEMQK